ncbi:MAG: biotin transporter BioY [Pseudomonadota bacterium]
MTVLEQRGALKVLAGAIGVCLLTASSYVSVPLYPVPVTMQTLAVLMLGVVLGPRDGALTVLSWLGLALAGAPVLANASGGAAAFAGPTVGYLMAFPVAAFLAGMLPKPLSLTQGALAFSGFLGLHGLMLASGWVWLSVLIGPETAFAAGVVPFLLGSVVKASMALGITAAWPAHWRP